MAIPDHQWRFDEAAGLIVYDLIGGKDGSLSNATRVSPGFSGVGAIQLVGTDNSFVDFTNLVGEFAANDFSIAFWIKTADRSLPLCDLVGNRTAPAHGNYVSLRMRETGIVIAEVDEDTHGKNYAVATSGNVGVNDGRWRHIALVRHDQTLTLYIDGRSCGTGTGSGSASINNGDAFKIGRSLILFSASRFSPNAFYDDFRIYHSAIDEQEVAEIIGWQPPDADRLFLATGVVESGDTGLLAGAGIYLAIDADNALAAIAQGPTSAAHIAFTVSGDLTRLSANGKYLKRDGEVIKATGESPADATPFYIFLTEAGDVIFSTEDRLTWRIGDDMKIHIGAAGRRELGNEFEIILNPVKSTELMKRYGIDPDTLPPITPCTSAYAQLIWQLSGGFFMVMGLGPFFSRPSDGAGLVAYMQRNPALWKAVTKAANALNKSGVSPMTVFSTAMNLIYAIWKYDSLSKLIRFMLKQIGYSILFKIVAKAIQLTFIPELEFAEIAAGLLVWVPQTIEAGIAVQQNCKTLDFCADEVRGHQPPPLSYSADEGQPL
ncbi:MAG TPA: LamG domain-containing protein [Methylocystis sp.]